MKIPRPALVLSVLLAALAANLPARAAPPARIVPSADGTPISYEVHGSGEPTLVFIHGWNCDSRYFREQIPFFSASQRVVAVDLAGHGHSGSSRSNHTMESFGHDVQAVLRDLDGGPFVLLGHSMGGIVAAHAARIDRSRILGLVAIDTLESVEFPLSREQYLAMTAPFASDFPSACRAFVQTMLVPATPAPLREWILSDMASAPPAVAMQAMHDMLSLYVDAKIAPLFDDLPLPVVGVYADLWPVDAEANRRHMQSFEAIVLPGTDHFLQLAVPSDFNPALQKALALLPGVLPVASPEAER